MSRGWNLEIDTNWIRRAADSMDEGSRAFSTVAVARLPLSAPGLGPSHAAAAAAALVHARNRQAHAAAAQLRALAAAVGGRLHDAADQFDLVESNIATPAR